MTSPDVRLFSFSHRQGKYHQVVVTHNYHKIEATISPTGSSIHVYIDGEKWGPVSA